MVGIEKIGKPDDKFQYNAQSEKEESIGIYETPFRGYDAQLGIFRQVDALAGAYSSITPYQFGFNNPISFNDPTGLEPDCPDCPLPDQILPEITITADRESSEQNVSWAGENLVANLAESRNLADQANISADSVINAKISTR